MIALINLNCIFPLFVDVIRPERVAKFQNAVCPNAAVERSFSKLNKILLKHRNFDANNVDKYICAFQH